VTTANYSGAPRPPGRRPRPRPLSDLAAAFGFLTLLPVGRVWPDDEAPRSVGWYPWVGWLLGVLAAAALVIVVRLTGHPPVKSAVLVGALIVAGWAIVTRLLHWDGLADTFDGLWGGADPARRLEIMRDSRVGSFGAAAMILVALVQVGAIADFASEGAWWPLVMAPVIARLAVTLAAWELPAARRDGLGLTAVRAPGMYDRIVAATAALALVALLVFGVPSRSFVLASGAGVAAAIAVPRLLARPVGGMTGDLFGATLLLTETVVLVMGALLA
jgi:adenosylcobinamide-GDP ribazoletransferase